MLNRFGKSFLQYGYFYLLWYIAVALIVLIEVLLMVLIGAVAASCVYGGLPHDFILQVCASLPHLLIYALSFARIWNLVLLLLFVLLDWQISNPQIKKIPTFLTAVITMFAGCFEAMLYFVYGPETEYDKGIFFTTNHADMLGYSFPVAWATFIMPWIISRMRILS